jgi:hypothetical protein
MTDDARTHWRLLTYGMAAFLLAAPAALAPARAASLDKNTCAKIAQDIQNMKALDVDKLMEKGPAWAVDNLSPGDLSLVRQYIDLDEQMKFRCSAPSSLVHLKQLEEEEDDNGPKAGPEPGLDKEKGAGGPGEKPAAPQAQPKAPAKRIAPSQANSGALR